MSRKAGASAFNPLNRPAIGEKNMEAFLPLIIQLVSGAVGGNVAGAAMKDKSLGTIGNSVAGLVGGVGGGQVLDTLLGMGGGGMDIGSILTQVAAGGVGGGALMAIAGIVKGMMKK